VSNRRQSASPQGRGITAALLGPLAPLALENYSNRHVWDVLLPKYLTTTGKVLEVGCAPGGYLLKLYKQFGLDPYGVDYEIGGVEETRRNFQQNGLDPARILHTDFFAAEFQEKYRASFDIVFSTGFIEHFPDPARVVQLHANLLKPGGQLVVMIPALHGLNYLIERVLNVEVLRVHNTEIMTKNTFANLFSLQPAYCDHYGSFDWHLFYAPRNTWRDSIFRQIDRTQPLVNLLSRLLLRGTPPTSALRHLLCPGLLFISSPSGA
jgi:SAM-dependent methyltransferase